MCRVVFTRGGVNYGKIIKTPAELDDVRLAMLSQQPPVPHKDIVRIEPVVSYAKAF
jgi:hypothetical protein